MWKHHGGRARKRKLLILRQAGIRKKQDGVWDKIYPIKAYPW
jgi:hypothetical protein